MTWVFLVLLYGVLKGGREIAKKKAMYTNTVMEVLVAYTVLSFVLVVPQAKDAGGMELKFYFLVALKAFAIFLAWICSFRSLKFLPVSLYGILSLSRILFATLLGVIVLHETLGIYQILGLILVSAGLLLLKFKPKSRKRSAVRAGAAVAGSNGADVEASALEAAQNQEMPTQIPVRETTAFFVALAFLSCIFNSVSGFMDKILMRDINSSQLQFWYMLFLVSYYVIYLLVKREKISFSVLKNKWVWLLAVMFVIGDKALFIANANPESRITVMTLLKQSACIITILGGKFIFKEKGIGYKLFCASIIITGIVLGVL
ncbi:MAG: EamA family transporter [Spirochaetaceae bacterium]|nr:EamA family transporter [Spirochaetaceae bacterium]